MRANAGDIQQRNRLSDTKISADPDIMIEFLSRKPAIFSDRFEDRVYSRLCLSKMYAIGGDIRNPHR